ncbi:MAG: acyl-CoA dehydrogenase [Hyphomonadaceae bacterium]
MSDAAYGDWIGRTQTRADLISPFPPQALAALLEAPAASVGIGAALPPGWQWLYFLDALTPAETGPDGHPRRGGFLPPIALERRMWAAGRFEMLRPLVIGQAAEKTSRVVSITPKRGASGEMIFVSVEHLISQNGALCLREEQTLVYRAMPTGPMDAQEVVDSTPSDWSAAAPTDPVSLFRYSALTYNGHRIHYDSAYAREVEHYPGLVVQAPFLATLLLNLVGRRHADAGLRTFEFRAIAPTFSGDSLLLHGSDTENGAVLWAKSNRGVGMRAIARFDKGASHGGA